MSDRKCARCDYRADDLTDHATETGHKLCPCCHRSLRDTEARVCDRCVTGTRDDLAAISRAYDQLPDIAYNAGYTTWQIPGGNAMVILAGGHAPTVDSDAWAAHDPIPVAEALADIEFWWREAKGEPTALEANLKTTTVYLRTRLGWAAETLESFPATVTWIRQLRLFATHAAGIADDPVRAHAECFDCGGSLLRVYRPAKSREQRLEQVKHRVNASAKRRRTAADVKERRRMVLKAVTGGDTEGLTDELKCSRCGETYTWAQYGLALRARADATSDWVQVKLAAEVARVPERTVRTWIDREELPIACDVATRRLVVWWHDVQKRTAELREAQQRAAERRAARAAAKAAKEAEEQAEGRESA